MCDDVLALVLKKKKKRKIRRVYIHTIICIKK